MQGPSKWSFLQWTLAALMSLTLVGLLTYVRMTFLKADIKLAVRLVEEVKVQGKPLVWKLDQEIPKNQRLCTAEEISKLYGHMRVTCMSTTNSEKKFLWSVNVFDGMVKPENQAAKDLGKE